LYNYQGDKVKQEKAKILVVDDEPVNRTLLYKILLKLDYVVETASDGYHALESVRAQSFDLVMLDLMMPDMDGRQVLKTMKDDPKMSDIPVIIVSALREKETVLQCLEMGATGYLIKPYQQEDIRLRVQSVLSNKYILDLEQALKDSEEQVEALQEENKQLRQKLGL
jgi:CheY-like chemotaxis protein